MAWVVIAACVAAAVAYLWVRNSAIAGNLPKIGDTAPGFALPDQSGGTRTLEEFRGKWLVLYFYPRDDTPGCTAQAMRFRDTLRELEAFGVAVCGVSVDDSASHAAFALKYHLPFALLADRGGAVAARYGSLRDLGVIRFARRNTFLIDPQGRVSSVYVGVNAARNADDVKEDLETLRRQSHGSATQGA